MLGLIAHIKTHLDGKQKYHKLFAESDSRVEGWYKGEMIFLLQQLKDKGAIVDFHREHKIAGEGEARYSVDFMIELTGNKSILVELKAVCISQAAGTPRSLNFYFGKTHVGLVKDFKKLDQIKGFKEKYVIGFVYPKPDEQVWNKGLKKLNSSYDGWSCISNFNEASKECFVSVWQRTKVR
jgi:hypothetical protein